MPHSREESRGSVALQMMRFARAGGEGPMTVHEMNFLRSFLGQCPLPDEPETEIGTISAAVLLVLDDGEPWHLTDIARCSKIRKSMVCRELEKLRKRGRVERVVIDGKKCVGWWQMCKELMN